MMEIDWSALLQQYGYFAVLLGSFLEGETVLMLGAYAAEQQLLNYSVLVTVAIIGSFLGDQVYYQLGAKYGTGFIEKRPKLAKKFHRACYFIDRYPILTILLMRFAWGLRTVLPISFGIKQFSMKQYVLVNIVACFIWSFSVIFVGRYVVSGVNSLWQLIA